MAAIAHYTLKVGDLPADTFKVLDWTGHEKISECYSFHITAICLEGDIDYEKIMGKPVKLKVFLSEGNAHHLGIVTHYQQVPIGDGAMEYEITFEPKFKLLAHGSKSRVFQNMDVKEIVSEVLKDNAFSDADFKFDAKDNFPKREYTVQYNESDLQFIHRLLEDEGVFYFFNHEGDASVLVLANQALSIKPTPHQDTIRFYPETDMNTKDEHDYIFTVHRKQQMVTGNAMVKDYNYRYPDTNVIGHANQKGQGEHYVFGQHTKSVDEANRLAKLYAELFACKKIVLEGQSVCRPMRSGYRFKMEDTHVPAFEGNYLVLEVHHHGDQREGAHANKTPNRLYSNSFACIPVDTQFRPERKTPKPIIHGVIAAKVDGEEGKYAYLDDQGRYRAKMPFDLGDKNKGQATKAIRLIQPYAGSNFGMHFPLLNGTEIILSFVDGDPDRPIAVGAVPNPNTVSPVNSRNRNENVIRTASGHQMRLDDKEGKTVFDVTTTGKHLLSMNDDPDKKEIHLKTTDGHELVFNDKEQQILIISKESGQTILLDNKNSKMVLKTKYGHQVTLDDPSKSLTVQTKDGHILKLDDDKKLIALQDGKGKHSLQIDVGGSKISITTEGDLQFSAKGKLDISAKEINMEAKSGAINIKAAKEIIGEGLDVSLKAKKNLTLEGTAEASMKGLNTKIEATVNMDIKGGVQTKVTGKLANLEADIMATVKGAIVMIN